MKLPHNKHDFSFSPEIDFLFKVTVQFETEGNGQN